MSKPTGATEKPLVAIACGGTGGHLFPGLAVADELLLHGCDVTLFVSPKEVDQEAVRALVGLKVVTAPAVAMSGGNLWGFVCGFGAAYRVANSAFRERVPQAVLGMGGFTSAPPVLAGKRCGAATFLHESNIIPGRANRWLAHVVDQAFVGFPAAAGRLHHANVLATGTPVRSQFQPADAAACRTALGLLPGVPLVLVMGGSQGASAVNDLVLASLPHLVRSGKPPQFLHLTGPKEVEKVKAGYAAHDVRASVRPFLTEIELALGAATVGVTRAGASSLAELAAMRLPPVLIPYPTATDDHQLHNAQALAEIGAAFVMEQRGATGERLAQWVRRMVEDADERSRMASALGRWHQAGAAELIAERVIALLEAMHGRRWKRLARPGDGASQSLFHSLSRHDATEFRGSRQTV
jgi:UDP-N-acetylglucosamine--N-acetylmuramyl-(pentapeptide) pyrophosphoryl-undecaprenol N-acetylglucosamine transferase